eukprot:TRINITY_DN1832_c0_g1_i2.p1 TRINITY_DN1832_c0_g1~~TRINITY_DN1832_c0_g1_i2.p1  ORF type:complete len:1364 (-),score=294.56 TRINITY_DN1832_c0_g1_i2:173-4264(-)
MVGKEEELTKEKYTPEFIFFLNGKKVELRDVQPETTLLQYLRQTSVGLTGTKLGCGEGGCGACTVMISQVEPDGLIHHRAINACLAPLCSVAGVSVTTIEGLGSTLTGLHPVQSRIASSHGSQCGFCTPGIVMALYAFLRENPKATPMQIEEAFDGNLCRCTGYRPILDAARTFACSDENEAHTHEFEGLSLTEKKSAEKTEKSAGGCGDCENNPDCCMNKTKREGTHCSSPVKYQPLDLKLEPIFPPFLLKQKPQSLCFRGDRVVWYRPLTLDGLYELRKVYPGAKLVVGNTEVGIEVKFRNIIYPVLISPLQVPELNTIKTTEHGIDIGSAVTLTRVKSFIEEQVATLPAHQTQTCKAILTQLKLFAGNQIRNAGCLGGNIATASPISDLNPVWVAVGVVLTVGSADGGIRKIPIEKFFLKYRVVDLNPSEVILSIHVPYTRPNEFVEAFKQSRRRDDDISIVCACFRLLVKDEVHPKKGHVLRVEDFGVGYGGMAVKAVSTPKTIEFLKGKIFDNEILEETYKYLAEDLPLPPGAPGGMIEYRRSLTTSFFFKFFLRVMQQKYPSNGTDLLHEVPPTQKSAASVFHRGVSRGEQHYKVANEDVAPVHQPIMHQSAEKQVTGEALYLDDIPNPQNGLFAAFVMSSKAHAKVLSVDPSKALEARGVVAFFGPKDIPGDNQIGPIFHDEELFASHVVPCMGYPLGIIVANTQQNALEASRLVDVKYEDLPTILTIDQAIEQNSYIPSFHHIIARGDLEEGFKGSDHVIEGEMRVGGQEHFYLETNQSFIVPGEGREVTVYASTQNPTKTQYVVAKILGIPANHVVVKVKRMGGGFGGKETRSIYVTSAAAVAAYHLRRPVRLVLDRDVDMVTSGYRHPFLGRYKVGFTKEGKVMALDLHLYADAGYSFDLSGGVMDRALFHSENAYNIPHIRVSGKLCKTNLPTNTAFRGFGGPQGMIICENWIEKIAFQLGVESDRIRELNFYKEGDFTHYRQQLVDCRLQRLWGEVKETSQFVERRDKIKKFNEENQWRKRGIAMIPTKFGMSFTIKAMNQAGALVHVYTDGTVLVTHGGTEMGQGLHTKVIQIAARALGVPVTSVHIAETATDKVANTTPTAASVQSDMNGMAVLNACEQIMEKLKPIREKHPNVSFKELVNIAYFERVNLSANGFYATPDVGYAFQDSGVGIGRPFNYFNYGAAVAEVELDALTGDHQILRVDILMDVGDSLNPAIDIGQVEGAFTQGIGWCLIEELVFFPNGYLFTRGPSTYKIPGFGDVPLDFRVNLLGDAPNSRAIHSSKGVGEPPLFLSASVFFAIRNAVRQARLSQGLPDSWFDFFSPATCERIRMSCEDRFTAQFKTPVTEKK